MHPDFANIAKLSASAIQKDGRHSLLIYSLLGVGLVALAFFNPENSMLLLIGSVFFFVLGIARYLVERYKRPILKVGAVQSKRAVPYTRIEGTFDYFIQITVSEQYEFSLHGNSKSLLPENESALKVSGDVFDKLNEGQKVMILFSSTKTLVGIFVDDHGFISIA